MRADLNVACMTERVKLKIRWYGLVKRMGDKEIKRMTENKMEVKRSVQRKGCK